MNHTQSKVKFSKQTETWRVVDEMIPFDNNIGKSIMVMHQHISIRNAFLFGIYEPCAVWHYLGVEKMDL